MKPKTTKEQWEQAAKWRDEGVKNAEIAKRLNVTPGRASQVLGKKRNLEKASTETVQE